MITFSEKYDFCKIKDIFIDGNRIGDFIKYDDNTFEIRVTKIVKSTTGKTICIHSTMNTNDESMIITIVANFINQH